MYAMLLPYDDYSAAFELIVRNNSHHGINKGGTFLLHLDIADKFLAPLGSAIKGLQCTKKTEDR